MSRWRALGVEQRQAAAAAVALALSMLLPWYSLTAVKGADKSLTAFGVFSWVEAAVLLVAAGVLYLLWARSNGRAFHLPGGDGWAISAGGAWTEFLLVWRLFDKPEKAGAVIGVTWGLFCTMAIAAVMVAAGQRLRAAHRPEPPNPAEDPTWEMPGRRPRSDRPRTPADPSAITEVLRGRRPEWEGEPPEPPGRAQRGPIAPPAPHPEAPPLWDDDQAPTRALPRQEPEEQPPAPPPGDQRLF